MKTKTATINFNLTILCGFLFMLLATFAYPNPFSLTRAGGNLSINELMASNTTTMADPIGEFDDWIEIKNNSASAINLNGYYLTDNPLNLGKWELPNTLLPPGGYLIIWADEDSSQGPTHANFKLSSLGEEIYLTSSPTGPIVDQVIFGVQTTDISYGRCADGVGTFDFMSPTFGVTNTCPVAVDVPMLTEAPLVFFPNPATDQITIRSASLAPMPFKVYNVMGEIIFVGKLNSGDTQIETGNWAKGLYFLAPEGSPAQKLMLR